MTSQAKNIQTNMGDKMKRTATIIAKREGYLEESKRNYDKLVDSVAKGLQERYLFQNIKIKR